MGNEPLEPPPWSEVNERAALACILRAGDASQAEVDALLLQLRPGLFYDLRHRDLLIAMTQMRIEQHAVDIVTLFAWITAHQPDLAGQWPAATLAKLSEEVGSYMNFAYFLEQLRLLARRRWCLGKAAELHSLAQSDQVKDGDIQDKFAELFEKSTRLGEASKPKIEVWTMDQYQAYIPDPKTFLVGADIISLGETAVIAGWQGLGKTRLANTLAYAGALGKGEWMGYEIKRRWKTLVLQSENNPRRIQSETREWTTEAAEYVRISVPTFMQFGDPSFRAELRRLWETWQFDMLILDNMNDVARDEGRADYLEALDNIRASLPAFPNLPAIVIIAHTRKQRGGENWKPKVGRELMHEIAGSLVLTAKARTVFAIQPVTQDMDDTRIVFETAKCNNEVPLPRSAWHVANNRFLPCQDWDEKEWLNPPDESQAKDVTLDMLRDLFANGKRQMKKGIAIEELRQLAGLAYSTAARYLNPKASKFKDYLAESDGLLTWKG